MKRIVLSCALAVCVLSLATPADALRFQARPAWSFGVGYGYGTANLDNGDGSQSEYRGGAIPQVRVGRMLHPHWMFSLNWQSWITEFGETPFKYRRTLQNLALAVAFFPGDPSGPVHGLFFRAGGGMGWAGTGRKAAVEGEAQHKGERVDEWGIGVFGEAGYEFWIARNITAGLMLTYNWFDIGEFYVDKAQFGGMTTMLNAYW